jgi:hypothetical protein
MPTKGIAAPVGRAWDAAARCSLGAQGNSAHLLPVGRLSGRRNSSSTFGHIWPESWVRRACAGANWLTAAAPQRHGAASRCTARCRSRMCQRINRLLFVTRAPFAQTVLCRKADLQPHGALPMCREARRSTARTAPASAMQCQPLRAARAHLCARLRAGFLARRGVVSPVNQRGETCTNAGARAPCAC